jgi:hypothetical protein
MRDPVALPSLCKNQASVRCSVILVPLLLSLKNSAISPIVLLLEFGFNCINQQPIAICINKFIVKRNVFLIRQPYPSGTFAIGVWAYTNWAISSHVFFSLDLLNQQTQW